MDGGPSMHTYRSPLLVGMSTYLMSPMISCVITTMPSLRVPRVYLYSDPDVNAFRVYRDQNPRDTTSVEYNQLLKRADASLDRMRSTPHNQPTKPP